jgi:hypothetical protein
LQKPQIVRVQILQRSSILKLKRLRFYHCRSQVTV